MSIAPQKTKRLLSFGLCFIFFFQVLHVSLVSAYSITPYATTGSNPWGMITDSSGNIYVSNFGSDNITKVTPAGVSTTFSTTGTDPTSMVMDVDNNLYVTNYLSNNVTKITPAGVSTTLGTTGSRPRGITIDSLGNIYTANYLSNNVTKITPAGVSTTLGTTGSGAYGITIDSLGNIYTANEASNNVTKITPAGVSTTLGTTGNTPRGITIDSLGNIYTANFGSNNVTKITPAGVSTTLGTTANGPFAIAIDNLGYIYTANLIGNNVTKITPAGVSTTLGTTGSSPHGIVLDLSGSIYVSNYSSNSITKITLPEISEVTPIGTTTDTTPDYVFNAKTDATTNVVYGGTCSPYAPASTSLISGDNDSTITFSTMPVGTYSDCTITITDAFGASNTLAISEFDIVSPNTTPTDITLSGTSVNDGASAPVAVGTLTTTDSDAGDTHRYFLNRCAVPGTDDASFSLSGDTLSLTTTPDYATQSSYNICIRTVDAGGLFYDKNFVITVVDTTPPALTLSGVSPMAVSQGSIFADPGATWADNVDGTGTLAFASSGSVDTAILGAYTLTYTYVDVAGNTGSISRTVNVVDMTPPSVPTCTASPSTTSGAITVTCNGTESGATITIPGLSCSPTPADVTGTVLCTGSILTSDPVLTITDIFANTATGTVAATLDTTAPVITLSGSGTITLVKNVPYTDAGATCTDNLDATCAVTSSGTVDTSTPGTYIIEYTATDAAGNTSTTTRTVTVVLGDTPVITLSGSSSVTVELGSIYTDAGATALDTEDGDITANIVANSTVNTGIVGTYTVTYNVTDSSDNTGATVTRTVNVVDTTAPLAPAILTPASGSILTDNTPTFTGTGEVGTTVTLIVGGQTLTGTVDASGNWSITPTVALADGTYTTSVTLTDASGNTSPTATLPFTLDTTAPAIILNGSGSITLPFGSAYTELGAKWTDAVDGTGTLLTPYTGSVNTNLAGTYTLTYQYIDRAGNKSTITRAVIVQPYVGAGGGGGGSPSTPIVPVTPTIPPSTPTDTKPNIPQEYQIQLLPTQSRAIPAGITTDAELVYTIENRITDYICPQIVQVYSEDELKARDIPTSGFRDDIKSMIMFRGLEKDEQVNGQTFEEYKRFGIAINDRTFEPTRNVTRAEYVKMLVRALSCRYEKEGTNTPFKDVDENMWYAEYINFATNHGWINGYQDGSFRPDAPITRAEAAKILANAIQLNTQKTGTLQSSFSDVPDNSVFTPYIEALKQNKVLSGRTKTTYAPDDYIPRTEVSRIIYRTFLGGNP